MIGQVGLGGYSVVVLFACLDRSVSYNYLTLAVVAGYKSTK